MTTERPARRVLGLALLVVALGLSAGSAGTAIAGPGGERVGRTESRSSRARQTHAYRRRRSRRVHEIRLPRPGTKPPSRLHREQAERSRRLHFLGRRRGKLEKPARRSLAEAKRRKKEWTKSGRRRGFHLWGRRKSEAPERPEHLGKALLEHSTYVVDAPRGGRRARRLLAGREVASDVKLLDHLLRRSPGLHPEGISRHDTARALDAIADFAEARALYLRPGSEGVADLLADEFLRDELVKHLAGGHSGRRRRRAERIVDRLADTARAVSLEPIDPDRPAGDQPLELQVLLEREPRAAELMRELEARGVPIRLQKLGSTPEDVLEAVNLISVVAQENSTVNWLPQLVREGRRPDLRPTENGMHRAEDLGLVKDGRVDQRKLERAADRIERAAGEYLRIVVGENSAGITDSSPEVRALNRALEPVRREWASRRLVFDNAQERTEGAQEIIKKMMVIGPAAHGLEMLNLGLAASLLTGSADDVMGEIAELKALRGAGFSRRELWKRAKVLVPVGGAAIALAAMSRHLLESGRPLEAGAAFGASAVALSLTTAVQSIHMYREAYNVLLREGKIPGKVGVAMEREFQQQLSQLEKEAGSLLEPEHRKQLVELVGRALDAEVASGGMERAEADAMLKDLAELDVNELKSQLKMPSSLKKWKEAVRQDFSNPARLGLILGASVAPLAGMVAAKTGMLDNGFVMAMVGSSESLVAGATVFAARKIDQWRYNSALKQMLQSAGKGRR